jgi:hypothetical protein
VGHRVAHSTFFLSVTLDEHFSVRALKFSLPIVFSLARGAREGCQKAVNYLMEYYGIRRMRVILDGRKVGNGDIAVYFENKTYFTKRGLNRRTVLHELYHHLAYVNGVDLPPRTDKKTANGYPRDFVNRHLVVH